MAAPSWADDVTPLYLSLLSNDVVPRTAALSFANDRDLEQSSVVYLDVCVDGAPPQLLFLKRANVEWLRRKLAKSAEKWAVSCRSFENESLFLLAAPACTMRAFQCAIPRCLGASVVAAHPDAVEGSEAWLDRTFTTLTERLPMDEYEEHRALGRTQALQALTYLARFHAFFWEGVGGPQGALDLFAPGGWWRAHLRPTVRFGDFSRVLADLCAAFPVEFGHLLASPARREAADWIGANTASIARATSDGEGPYRTLVHGDFKTSNVFWDRSSRCTAIDFQWTGRGRSGMGDVAYLLTSGVQYDVLAGKGALQELLGHYHSELVGALVERLGPESSVTPGSLYMLDAVWVDWQLEVVDFAKTALPYLLDGLTPAVARENAAKYGWLTCEDDPRCTAWLVEQALEGAIALQGRAAAGRPLGWVS